jgi:simple sugar transport system permease protein
MRMSEDAGAFAFDSMPHREPRPELRVVRVQTPSRRAAVAVPALSIATALLVAGLVLLAAGENPLEVYWAMARGALGDRNGVAETLVKTIPLLLTGLGVAVAFRMQLWNIGAEGQLYLGAIAATGTGLFLLPEAPAIILVPALIVAGLAGGAAWGLVPGALRAYLGANEIITSLMLNYVAILFSEYLVHGPWRDPGSFGFPGTPPLPDAAWLPRWSITRVHLGLVFGLVAAAWLWVVLRRTRWGYEIAVAGDNPRAARYAGMPTRRTILTVMALSGALAGLAGMSEVAGIGHQLQRNLSPGYGYTAIIVAWLGRLNPLGIVLVAFLLAAVLVGGDQLQISSGLPAAIAPMLQGTILFCLLGGEVLTRYRVVRAESKSAIERSPPLATGEEAPAGSG